VGKAEGKRPLGRLDAGGRIILKQILERQDEVAWIRLNWFRTGTIGGPL
jgi:hypothetical protein